MENISKEKIQFYSPSAIIVNDAEGPETYPPHWHNAAEFTLVLEDGLKYRISGKLYNAEKGDILLVWPHQIHETVKAPAKGAIFIQFPSTVLENSLDLISISRFLYACHHLKPASAKTLCSFIQDKIWEIKKIHNSSDPFSETKCKLCIYEIILAIGERELTESQKNLSSDTISGTGWNYVNSACRYIAENSSEDITQAHVAKQLGLSSYYFSKLFKQYMHMSFPSYLSNIRVRHAASLLMDEKYTITECAFQAGFQSTTAFNKAFLDITGHSPREYRKLYR
jgi:AraC-like DNA-binding protein